MKIAAAQISCVSGDLKANIGKIREFASLAKDASAELVVFPEMVDTGYSMPIIQKHATFWEEGSHEGASPSSRKRADLRWLSLGPATRLR